MPSNTVSPLASPSHVCHDPIFPFPSPLYYCLSTQSTLSQLAQTTITNTKRKNRSRIKSRNL